MKSACAGAEYVCAQCGEDGIGWCYACAACRVERHLTCVQLPMKDVFEQRPAHLPDAVKSVHHAHHLVRVE